MVRIECEDDGGEPSHDSDAICIERSRLEDAVGLGLTLEDGKCIMAFLQARVVTDQLREHCRSTPDAPSASELGRSRTTGSG